MLYNTSNLQKLGGMGRKFELDQVPAFRKSLIGDIQPHGQTGLTASLNLLCLIHDVQA